MKDFSFSDGAMSLSVNDRRFYIGHVPGRKKIVLAEEESFHSVKVLAYFQCEDAARRFIDILLGNA